VPLRIGLIGCGRIAHAHLRGYLRLPELFSVVACCDINLQAAEEISRQLVGDIAIFMVGVTQLDVGAAAKPTARVVLTPYKGCFRADYRLPLHKTTSTA